MKGRLAHCLVFVGILSGMLASCSKKANLLPEAVRFSQEVGVQASDEARISYEIDAIFNDVNTVLAEQTKLTGARATNPIRTGVTVTGGPIDTVQSSICGVLITTDAVDTPNDVVLYYSGYNCDNSRYRYGMVGIYFTPGSRWTTAGDTVFVVITNMAVTRPDKEIIILNGTYAYSNVSGGSLSSLSTASPGPLVHTITGTNVGFNFSDSVHTIWQVARQRTYTYSNNNVVITTIGTATDTVDGLTNVAEWGGNRYGNSVIETIPPSTPLVISSGCGWQIMSGQVNLINPIGVTNVTYGLDSTGKATGCPLPGSTYYFHASWAGSGEDSVSLVGPYF